jgi:TolB protein
MTIYTIKHDGTGTTQVSTDPGLNWAPHPAPDGVHFAYVRMPEPGNFEVFVMNMKTKQKRQLTFNKAFDGYPSFSPDGKTLAFATSRDAQAGERKVWTYLMDVSSLGIRPLSKK